MSHGIHYISYHKNSISVLNQANKTLQGLLRIRIHTLDPLSLSKALMQMLNCGPVPHSLLSRRVCSMYLHLWLGLHPLFPVFDGSVYSQVLDNV